MPDAAPMSPAVADADTAPTVTTYDMRTVLTFLTGKNFGNPQEAMELGNQLTGGKADLRDPTCFDQAREALVKANPILEQLKIADVVKTLKSCPDEVRPAWAEGVAEEYAEKFGAKINLFPPPGLELGAGRSPVQRPQPIVETRTIFGLLAVCPYVGNQPEVSKLLLRLAGPDGNVDFAKAGEALVKANPALKQLAADMPDIVKAIEDLPQELRASSARDTLAGVEKMFGATMKLSLPGFERGFGERYAQHNQAVNQAVKIGGVAAVLEGVTSFARTVVSFGKKAVAAVMAPQKQRPRQSARL